MFFGHGSRPASCTITDASIGDESKYSGASFKNKALLKPDAADKKPHMWNGSLQQQIALPNECPRKSSTDK
jgi:hypothetical protein